MSSETYDPLESPVFTILKGYPMCRHSDGQSVINIGWALEHTGRFSVMLTKQCTVSGCDKILPMKDATAGTNDVRVKPRRIWVGSDCEDWIKN